MQQIGCFVTSHGLGHATRVSAVLEALSKRVAITPHIFSTAGEEVFRQTLNRFIYHHQLTDIGFVQHDAFQVDIDKTCSQLETLIPYRNSVIEPLASMCRDCLFILCDISGIGIKVAQLLGIPAVLVENFTWDWLYASYDQQSPAMHFFRDYLAEIYNGVDIRIKTEPACQHVPVDMHCGPIYRTVRQEPGIVKSALECEGRKLVLITLGGIGFHPDFLEKLKEYDDYYFLFGGQQKDERIGENLRLLDRFSDYYHPDLINSADVVVFKSGYSSLAECYQCGKPSICIQREGFAESPVLESFAEKNLSSKILSQKAFVSGSWLELLPDLPLQGISPARCNGADQVAEILLPYLV